MENKITGNSYIRLKNDINKIYKVTSINTVAQLVDATQKNGRRVALKLSDVELASSHDIFKYDDNSTQIEY